MSLNVTILGSGSAVPVPGRHPSAQLVAAGPAGYLVDCGEGTQYRLRDFRLGFSKIKAICISHLHGDHYYGLFGLLDTMALTSRKEPLYLIAPEELRSLFVELRRVTKAPPSFPIFFVSTDASATGAEVYADERVSIETFPLDHRTPCTGFLFRTRQSQRKIRKDKLVEGLTYQAIHLLKEGKDVYDSDGHVLFSVDEFTHLPAAPQTYAYCSDTIYKPSLCAYLQGVDLLYHEATFAADLAEKAHLRGHATAAQAALIARDSRAGRLLIGHLSSRYHDAQLLIDEARTVFPNTEYAEEGMTFSV